MEATFFTVKEGGYKYGKGEYQNITYSIELHLELPGCTHFLIVRKTNIEVGVEKGESQDGGGLAD